MTNRTPLAPIEVRKRFMEEPLLGAGNFLDYALEANPNRAVPYAFTHHIDHTGTVSVRGHSLEQIAAQRDRYASWYHANGVRPKEPVGVVVGDGLEPIIHFFALTALGAIPTLINDAMPSDVMVRYLNHVGVVGVVADDTTKLAAAYRADPQSRPRFVALSYEVQSCNTAQISLPSQYPYQHAADDVVGLIHSSGTTGTPKASKLGHRQFWDGKQPRMVRFPADETDKLYSLMPHTHAGGLSYFLTTTLIGLPTMVASDWRRATVEPVMEAFQPTMMASFPRTFVELATGELPTAGAANVHSWFNTGDSAHYGHVRRLVDLGRRPGGLIKPWLLPQDHPADRDLPGSQYIDGLGSTEMGMALFGQVTTPESERDDRCIGKPSEAVTDAAILDVEGQHVPDGTVGMLAVKSPSLTAGYWNNARLTESFRLNGYWLTGDIAYRKPDGRFYHLDRTVDVIDTENGPVYSLLLEEVLLADCSAQILDCSVVGVAAASGIGLAPVAIVKLQRDAEDTTQAQLLELVNAKLSEAGLATLHAVRIARTDTDFPLGPTGKVLKREVRTKMATILTD